MLFAVSALAPPPDPTVPLLVAARELPAGARLAAEDLVTVRVPPEVVPAGALTRAAALEQVLNAPVSTGEPLTSTRVRYSSLLAGAPGTVALPVRVADAAAASVVAPGDRIDLLATVPDATSSGTGTVRTVGRDLPVLLSPGQPDGSRDDDALGAITDPWGADGLGGMVVVAASTREATTIVAASAQGSLWLAVRQHAGSDAP